MDKNAGICMESTMQISEHADLDISCRSSTSSRGICAINLAYRNKEVFSNNVQYANSNLSGCLSIRLLSSVSIL